MEPIFSPDDSFDFLCKFFSASQGETRSQGRAARQSGGETRKVRAGRDHSAGIERQSSLEAETFPHNIYAIYV